MYTNAFAKKLEKLCLLWDSKCSGYSEHWTDTLFYLTINLHDVCNCIFSFSASRFLCYYYNNTRVCVCVDGNSKNMNIRQCLSGLNIESLMKGRYEKSFSNKLCSIISTDIHFEGNLFVPFLQCSCVLTWMCVKTYKWKCVLETHWYVTFTIMFNIIWKICHVSKRCKMFEKLMFLLKFCNYLVINILAGCHCL